uniref:(California timema) hypothetical protein n=1 Tax=Timema californicum TaxID=61474 RepID=A0A7R9J1E9_TIMCA|nr:unnamed protein product [Timema californicum]
MVGELASGTTMSPMAYLGRLTLLSLCVSLVCGSMVTDCGPQFQGKCLCGIVDYQERMHQYVVNCTNSGFKNTAMLEFLPSQTEVLIFTGNFIQELPWNVFGTFTNLSHLRVVDMSNNGIREIKGKAYHRVANVERLVLNHNDLVISETESANYHHRRVFSNFVNLIELHLTDAFADNTPENLASDLHDIFVSSGLTKLIKLHLEQNEISIFKDPRIFCDLPSLMDLHLSDNLLTGLHFNITCLEHLRFLDLESNKIAGLTKEDLEILDSFPKREQNLVLDLRDNPFLCDCAVQELYTWLQTTKVEVRNRDVLRCHKGLPESNKGELVLDVRQIQCPLQMAASQSIASSHYATAVVLGLLLTVLAVLGIVVVYLYRADIKRGMTPIVNNVSRKVQYTSIGRQPEDQEMEV